jgi:hypothetical protein
MSRPKVEKVGDLCASMCRPGGSLKTEEKTERQCGQ